MDETTYTALQSFICEEQHERHPNGGICDDCPIADDKCGMGGKKTRKAAERDMLAYIHKMQDEIRAEDEKKKLQETPLCSPVSPQDGFEDETGINPRVGKWKLSNRLFPQHPEPNEYRFLVPGWIDALALGMTAGHESHPEDAWTTIPATEHLWRAARHIIMYLSGNRTEDHIMHASMRLMMAWATAGKDEKHEREED